MDTQTLLLRLKQHRKEGLMFLLLLCSIMGIVWCLNSPSFGSVKVTAPPDYAVNDPAMTVYLGQGCFWHTQYDFVLLEQATDGAFGGRGDEDITSLVGYAGGLFRSGGGAVCYHGLPSTDYHKLGHGEVVGVELDANATVPQMAALAEHYFRDGFSTDSTGRLRLDPGDQGAQYRNVIGIPGGVDGPLFSVLEDANDFDMPLLRGEGGPYADHDDNYVVYIYDTNSFPFFRGEKYHQFHTNDVLGRPVPASYTDTLKDTQSSLGRLDSTGCPNASLSLLSIGLMMIFFVTGGCALVSTIGCVSSLCNPPSGYKGSDLEMDPLDGDTESQPVSTLRVDVPSEEGGNIIPMAHQHDGYVNPPEQDSDDEEWDDDEDNINL